MVIEIGGHTNGRPTHEFCDSLSEARAKSVAQFLYNKNIPYNQVEYKGYGKRQPVASDRYAEGRQRNQRVEIKILSIEHTLSVVQSWIQENDKIFLSF